MLEEMLDFTSVVGFDCVSCFFYSKLISFLYIGAAYAHAEKPLQEFVERSKLPFLPTPMGKGVISDDHSLCVAAARSRYI